MSLMNDNFRRISATLCLWAFILVCLQGAVHTHHCRHCEDAQCVLHELHESREGVLIADERHSDEEHCVACELIARGITTSIDTSLCAYEFTPVYAGALSAQFIIFSNEPVAHLSIRAPPFQIS